MTEWWNPEWLMPCGELDDEYDVLAERLREAIDAEIVKEITERLPIPIVLWVRDAEV